MAGAGLVVVLTNVECARLSHRLWSILTSFVQSRSNYFLRAINDPIALAAQQESGSGTGTGSSTPVSDSGFGRATNRSSEWHPAARLLLHTHVPKSEFHRCTYSPRLQYLYMPVFHNYLPNRRL